VKQLSSRLAQWQALRSVLPVVYLPTIIAIAIALILLPDDIPASFLTRDPASIAGEPAYFGLFSNIGVLFWCAAAAICLFCAVVCQKIARNWQLTLFFLASGCFTTLLLLDDLFLFHERLYPRFLFGETVAFSLYGAILGLLLLCFRRLVATTDFILLLLALGFLGTSAIADLAFESDPYLIEAGSKLLGIVSWFAYWSRAALQQLGRLILERR